jgi:hypothetical protein
VNLRALSESPFPHSVPPSAGRDTIASSLAPPSRSSKKALQFFKIKASSAATQPRHLASSAADSPTTTTSGVTQLRADPRISRLSPAGACRLPLPSRHHPNLTR